MIYRFLTSMKKHLPSFFSQRYKRSLKYCFQFLSIVLAIVPSRFPPSYQSDFNIIQSDLVLISIERDLTSRKIHGRTRHIIHCSLFLLFSIVFTRGIHIMEKNVLLLFRRWNFGGCRLHRPRHLAHFTEISTKSIATGNTGKDNMY